MATKKERPAPPQAPKSRPAVKPETTKPQSATRPESTFTGNAQAEVSPEELRKLISEAAYFRAKQRGFAPGYELEDWKEAEAEVMRRIGGRQDHSA
jgi:hypothetical protein